MKNYTMTTEEAAIYDNGNDVEIKALWNGFTERFDKTTEIYHPEGFVAWVINS